MSHSLKLSSLQSLAAATAAQSGFSAPVTTPAGDTHAISDVNQLKFNEWTMIRDNAPKGPLFLAQTMVRIEKGLPEGTDLVEKVDFLFQSLHKALTPYFNWMFDAKEKHLITEGHLSTLQQRLAEQYENPALETIWEKCLSNLFQFPEGVERPVGHAAIRAFLNNPENAAQIQAVTVLDLGGNDLYTLPPEIGLFTGLTRLHAAQNQLYYLPEEIGNLKSLTELHLNNNKLAILPDSFYTLPALNKLYLMNNSFSSLPKSFANLTTLTDLSFSDNQFNSFPESICSLTNITYLSFDRNQLSSLPNSFGNLITIRNLNLANNLFTSLPEPIRELTQLGALDLYQNQLTSLPDWIGDFANLRFLNLSHSPLKILPDSIQRLTNLIKLRLNNIQLRSLPEWIGNLTALNSIELRGNRLSFLPESFVNLTALQWLYLTENWLVSIPNFSREIALTYKNNPFFIISDLELDISFDINLQILQERQREMLEYPSESSLASLFQLILRRADVSEIENTFD